VYENLSLKVVMGQSWINASRISDVYDKGVEDFLEFAEWNGARINVRYYCRCVNCVNGRRLDIKMIRKHVICDGFLKNYTTWTWHGKVLDLPHISETDQCQHSNIYSEDSMKDMIRDLKKRVSTNDYKYRFFFTNDLFLFMLKTKIQKFV